MTTTNNQIPQLRFPEFEGKWVNKNLGDIAKFSKGKGISKNDVSIEGEIECIRYGELYTKYNEVINNVFSKTNVDVKNLVLSEANDVIIPSSGETQIDIATASCVLKKGIALGGDLNIIKTDHDGIFLSFYLNNRKKREISNLAQGISVVHLYSSQLATLTLNLPSLPEQTRIASFFTTIDQKLSQLKQKKTLLEQYKKGVMQKIFSQELRFKNENEVGEPVEPPKWKKKKLGEVGYFKGGGTPSTTNPDYWQGDIPWLSSSDLFDDSIFKIKVTRFITKEAITKSASKIIPRNSVLIVSRVGVGKVAVNEVELCTSQDFSNLIVQSGNYIFLAYLIKFKTNQLLGFNQGTSIKGFVKSDLEDLVIQIPCLAEQTKIANFLSTLDQKINHTQTQIEKMEVWKKGLLQKMFC